MSPQQFSLFTHACIVCLDMTIERSGLFGITLPVKSCRVDLSLVTAICSNRRLQEFFTTTSYSKLDYRLLLAQLWLQSTGGGGGGVLKHPQQPPAYAYGIYIYTFWKCY